MIPEPNSQTAAGMGTVSRTIDAELPVAQAVLAKLTVTECASNVMAEEDKVEPVVMRVNPVISIGVTKRLPNWMRRSVGSLIVPASPTLEIKILDASRSASQTCNAPLEIVNSEPIPTVAEDGVQEIKASIFVQFTVVPTSDACAALGGINTTPNKPSA